MRQQKQEVPVIRSQVSGRKLVCYCLPSNFAAGPLDEFTFFQAILVQKAALAAGISSRELSAVLALQAALAEAGWSAKEISAAFGTIASNGGGGDLKQARL